MINKVLRCCKRLVCRKITRKRLPGYKAVNTVYKLLLYTLIYLDNAERNLSFVPYGKWELLIGLEQTFSCPEFLKLILFFGVCF